MYAEDTAQMSTYLMPSPFWQECSSSLGNKKEIYVGFSSDKLKNVLEGTVSSKPVEVSDITELFLRIFASSAKSGRQSTMK